jgi:hypothetical protein
MKFDDDIRAYVLSNLPYDPAKRAELAAMTAADLLILYLNWRNRLVPPRPRRAHQSRALLRNPVFAARTFEIDQLISKIINGDDLTPHLSERIRHGYESHTAGKYSRRRDLDLMLAEWQVHHLHLSSIVESNGFVKRDNPLLFVAFRPDDAYLVDIFEHGEWTKEVIAQTLIDEWPGSGFVHEVRDAVGLGRRTSENERGALRSAGISSPFMEHNGKVYMIGFGGLTATGTAVAATLKANSIMRSVRAFEEHLAENPDYIGETLKSGGLQPPETCDLHFVFTQDGGYGIIEAQTKALFSLTG